MRKIFFMFIFLIIASNINYALCDEVKPCLACHPTMKDGYRIPQYALNGNIYKTISISCPEYAKVLKQKFYTEELIMKSEELLSKLKERNFYTLPLEKALIPVRQRYLEINAHNIMSAGEYEKENLKLRFELDKTYTKLADFDFGFKGRTVFSITILTMIFLFVILITGWKKSHNKKKLDIKKYLDEQEIKNIENN